MMSHRINRCSISLLFIALAATLLFLLAGCSASPGTTTRSTTTGVGADGGSWPDGPNRNTTSSRPGADEAPKAQIALTLHGKVAGEDELALSITKVELQYDQQWMTLAAKADIDKLAPHLVRISAKHDIALLTKTQLIRRKFTAVRLYFDKDSALFRNGAPLPLAIDAVTLSLDGWMPDTKALNALEITVDGTQVQCDGKDARLPVTAVSAAQSTPTGSVQGKVTPVIPGGSVQVVWANSDMLFGEAIPQGQDGTFTIDGLPSGNYAIRLNATGYQPKAALPTSIRIEKKAITVDPITLVKVQ